MNIADLMVGDWVLVKELDHDDKTIVVSEYQHQIKLKDFAEAYDAGKYKVYEPISLTPGILEKNGFTNSYINEKLDKSEIYVWYDVYGYEVTVNMKNNNIKVKHDTRILLDLWYTEKVPVHELQLALKHCGIKKEITI